VAVDPEQAAASRRRLGTTRWFCSDAWGSAFDAHPRRYVATSPAARAARSGFLIDLGLFLAVGLVRRVSWLARGHERGVPPLVPVRRVGGGARRPPQDRVAGALTAISGGRS
jgi:YHS domain-containing protein